MLILRGIQNNRITQIFGENKVPFYKEKGMLGHNGIDLALDNGDPIYWDCDTEGVVLETHIDSSGGMGVIMGSQNGNKYFKHIFWHLQEILAQPGELYETGALLGYGDNTGMSTGPHLHRGLKETDEDYQTINWDNGYRGGIDIAPFMKNIFVLHYMETLKTTIKILEAKKVNLLWAIVLALRNTLKRLLRLKT